MPTTRTDQLASLIPQAAELIATWEERFGGYSPHPASAPDPDRLAAAWEAFGARMAEHYPFFHPRYAGQMLKPPHPVAVAGYLAAMLVNPTTTRSTGGPARARWRSRSSSSCARCSASPAPCSAT